MRLIDADALSRIVKLAWDTSDSEDFEKSVFIAIATAPTIDPVKRGRWEMGGGFPFPEWTCSRCNCIFCGTEEFPKKYKFCPQCGADMREERRRG